jgi:nonsense-mediated mRNA decay protein 3
LEQLIIKHNAAASAVNIKQIHDGMDFYFSNKSHGLKLLDFLSNVVPVRSRHDKQLVSHDTKSNTYNYRFTMSVEICPVCKDDLICLPPKVAASLGNIGPLVLCTQVSNSLLLLDPQTLRNAYMDASQYWRTGFRPLLHAKQLVEYIVLDVEAEPGV